MDYTLTVPTPSSEVPKASPGFTLTIGRFSLCLFYVGAVIVLDIITSSFGNGAITWLFSLSFSGELQ